MKKLPAAWIAIFFIWIPAIAAEASELDDDLGLSIDNISTNSFVVSPNIPTFISQGASGTPISVLETSSDPFFPEVSVRSVLRCGEDGGATSARIVLRQFASNAESLGWTVGMVHGTSMAEDDLALHYSVRHNIDDICLCWHSGETNKQDSSITSVTIIRGNLVAVASGNAGTNLVEVSRRFMDAICGSDE